MFFMNVNEEDESEARLNEIEFRPETNDEANDAELWGLPDFPRPLDYGKLFKHNDDLQDAYEKMEEDEESVNLSEISEEQNSDSDSS